MATDTAVAAPASEAPVVKKAKTPAQRKPKTPKAAPAHPTYLQMSAEAIGALKDRTGSSQQAIAKWVEERYKDTLPSNFKKQLSVQLKKLSQKGKLVQIKHSYKLSEELKKPTKPVVSKPAEEKKNKKILVKKVVKGPKSPKLVKTAAKSGAPKVAKPKSVKSVKPTKSAAKPAAGEKKVVKKVVPVTKKAATLAKKAVSTKKAAPKKPKSAKKASKPKATPAKKAKVAA